MSGSTVEEKAEVVVMESYPDPGSYSHYVNNRYRAITTIAKVWLY